MYSRREDYKCFLALCRQEERWNQAFCYTQTWSIVSELTTDYRQLHLLQFNAHKQKADSADDHIV